VVIVYPEHVAVLQPYIHNNIMELFENEPSVPVVITPTVPVSCPPCSVNVSLGSIFGLIVATCSVTFYSTDQPRASRTIYIRAMPTFNAVPRNTELQFHPASTQVSGTGWDGYSIPSIPVSIIGADSVWAIVPSCQQRTRNTFSLP